MQTTANVDTVTRFDRRTGTSRDNRVWEWHHFYRHTGERGVEPGGGEDEGGKDQGGKGGKDKGGKEKGGKGGQQKGGKDQGGKDQGGKDTGGKGWWVQAGNCWWDQGKGWRPQRGCEPCAGGYEARGGKRGVRGTGRHGR